MSGERQDKVACRIEGAGDAARAQARSQQGPEPAGPSAGEARGDAAQGHHAKPVTGTAGRWLSEAFPACRGSVLGGAVGLVTAVMLLTIGVWRTLVIVVLVALGIVVGQYVDGDPKMIRAIQRLLKR